MTLTSVFRATLKSAWAAREEMVAEGRANDADVTRWAEAFSRFDAERPPWLFPALFVALGRRGGKED